MNFNIMTSKKYDFTGKVVLITGSSSGIGAACAEQFAQCNAKVVITGYEEAEVNEIVNKIEKITNEKPLGLAGNLSDLNFCETLITETIKKYGRLDVLVNNAGRASAGDSLLNPDFMQEYDKIMDLNLRAVFKLVHLAVPHLEATKGNVVNVSSVGGLSPIRKSLYCASKAGVNMLTKCAAVDLGDKGIRVNAVNPGPIKTNFGRSVGQPSLMLIDNECPETSMTIMKRNGEADEVANMILFLASGEASYITGTNCVVDGGFLCH